MAAIQERGFLPQTPWLPDLAPWDYNLFPIINMELSGHSFEIIGAAVNHFLAGGLLQRTDPCTLQQHNTTTLTTPDTVYVKCHDPQ